MRWSTIRFMAKQPLSRKESSAGIMLGTAIGVLRNINGKSSKESIKIKNQFKNYKNQARL